MQFLENENVWKFIKDLNIGALKYNNCIGYLDRDISISIYSFIDLIWCKVHSSTDMLKRSQYIVAFSKIRFKSTCIIKSFNTVFQPHLSQYTCIFQEMSVNLSFI